MTRSLLPFAHSSYIAGTLSAYLCFWKGNSHKAEYIKYFQCTFFHLLFVQDKKNSFFHRFRWLQLRCMAQFNQCVRQDATQLTELLWHRKATSCVIPVDSHGISLLSILSGAQTVNEYERYFIRCLRRRFVSDLPLPKPEKSVWSKLITLLWMTCFRYHWLITIRDIKYTTWARCPTYDRYRLCVKVAYYQSEIHLLIHSTFVAMNRKTYYTVKNRVMIHIYVLYNDVNCVIAWRYMTW